MKINNTQNNLHETSFGLRLDKKTAQMLKNSFVEGDDIVKNLLKDSGTDNYTASLVLAGTKENPSMELHVTSDNKKALLKEFSYFPTLTETAAGLSRFSDFLEQHVSQKTFAKIANEALNDPSKATITLPSSSQTQEKIYSPIRNLLSKLGFGK